MRTYNSNAMSWRGNDLRCAGKTSAGKTIVSIALDRTYGRNETNR
jgi:hypothetical protein